MLSPIKERVKYSGCGSGVGSGVDSGVSLSAVKLNILDSNGFGLEWIFKGKCRKGQYEDRDALYVQTRTGEKPFMKDTPS